ncbi:hypothetical protein HanPI659440_Chr11g0429011 [Helianthus annuus]|nr:hypothetical protein HanPI659440_Chr11g0429011 [Helianthus annuus]
MAAGSIPRTVADILGDYCGRHKGLIRALTDDVEAFFAQCDPGFLNYV